MTMVASASMPRLPLVDTAPSCKLYKVLKNESNTQTLLSTCLIINQRIDTIECR